MDLQGDELLQIRLPEDFLHTISIARIIDPLLPQDLVCWASGEHEVHSDPWQVSIQPHEDYI